MIALCLVMSTFAICISAVSIAISLEIIEVKKPKEDKAEVYRTGPNGLLRRPPTKTIED